MQNHTIVLCGMERSFMQKLALYLKERLNEQTRVGIAENFRTAAEEYGGSSTVWIGASEFMEQLKATEQKGVRITVSGEQKEEENHIFQYQSREKLYRAIWEKCEKFWGKSSSGKERGRQRWFCFTGDTSAVKLMACSLTAAQILGRAERVLYLNLSECCGMKQLFQLNSSQDLSDLFLRLRKGEDISLEACAGKLDQADYILPCENPMIVHEIGEEDVKRLLELVRSSSQYSLVVFALGMSVCGCRQILAESSRIWHLTETGILAESARNEWMEFLRQCVPQGHKAPQLITVPEITADSFGPHLVSDWTEGATGKMLRQLLML